MKIFFGKIITIYFLVMFQFNMAFASSEAEMKPKVIKIDPGVKKVIVINKEYDFKEEKEEFAQFRKRYMIFWVIFNLSAFILPYVW